MIRPVVVGGREGTKMPECLVSCKTIEISQSIAGVWRSYPPMGESWPGHIVVSGELWEHIQAGYGGGAFRQGDGFLRFQMTDPKAPLWALYGMTDCPGGEGFRPDDVHFDLIDSGVKR